MEDNELDQMNESMDQEMKEILEEEEEEEGTTEESETPTELKAHNVSTLELLARITGNKIETKEVIDEWMLITFDIPTTQEGNKARSEFYKKAYALGAVQNTESVYLCPWTADAELMTLEIAAVSDSRVIVFSRAKTSVEQSREITRRYDNGLKKVIRIIRGRIDKLEYMIQHKYYKRAQRYTTKTERLLTQLENAVIRRGSAQMLIEVSVLFQRFNSVFARI